MIYIIKETKLEIMKVKQIRLGVFETNSSSTHSLVVCTKEEYEKWKLGELFFKQGREPNIFITKQDVDDILRKDNKQIDDADLMEYDIYDFESWSRDYEEDTIKYTTKGGDELIIRSYFGYDG